MKLSTNAFRKYSRSVKSPWMRDKIELNKDGEFTVSYDRILMEFFNLHILNCSFNRVFLEHVLYECIYGNAKYVKSNVRVN